MAYCVPWLYDSLVLLIKGILVVVAVIRGFSLSNFLTKYVCIILILCYAMLEK